MSVTAGAVLVAGCVAWVFPNQAASALGPWGLPAVSILSLALALALATDGPVLRACSIVLAATLVVGWARAFDSTTATPHFAGACLGLLTMFLVPRFATTPQRLRLATVGFLVGALAALVLGFFGTAPDLLRPIYFGPARGRWPVIRLGLVGLDSTGLVNPNALAALALMTLPLGLAVLLVGFRRRIDQLSLVPIGLLVAVAGLFVLAVIRSTSAWLAIWLMLVASLAHGGIRSVLPRILVGLTVAALPVVLLGQVQILSREAFMLQASLLWTSVHSRLPIMAAGVRQITASPWLGIGLNQFRHVYQPPAASPGFDVAHAHNMLLQTVLDVGIVGAVAYYAILVLLLIRAGKAARLPSRLCRCVAIGAALSLALVSVFGLADAVPLGAKVGLFYWMAAGLVLAAWQVALGASEDERAPAPKRMTEFSAG